MDGLFVESEPSEDIVVIDIRRYRSRAVPQKGDIVSVNGKFEWECSAVLDWIWSMTFFEVKEEVRWSNEKYLTKFEEPSIYRCVVLLSAELY